jgi:hypothetical protein
MERGILFQHLEAIVICEENFTDVDDNMVILNIYPMMNGENKRVKKLPTSASKLGEKECQYRKKSNH